MIFHFLVSWNGKCVRDGSARLLPTNAVPGFPYSVPSITPTKCIEACDDKGFLFAGVQFGHECWCGNDAPPHDRIVAKEECNVSCSGDSSLKCGGVWRMNVYRIEGQDQDQANKGIVRPCQFTKFSNNSLTVIYFSIDHIRRRWF